MDLGTDYCYAGVLLDLLRSLTQGGRRCLERCSCLLSFLLAGCLLNERARQSLLLAGDCSGDTITLAHPEGPYMQMHRSIRQELNPPGEFGEWIEDAALHNPLPH